MVAQGQVVTGGGAPHTHPWNDITGEPATFPPAEHTHIIANVTGLPAQLTALTPLTTFDELEDRVEVLEASPPAHQHAQSDVTGLVTALDGKAPAVHTHAIADTSGLQGALDAKAATGHTHAIANVTGLQDALDGKADDADLAALEENRSPTIMVWDGTQYLSAPLARVYVGGPGPSSPPDGTVHIEVA